jgi:putative hydrolase of the HAD superfamily
VSAARRETARALLLDNAAAEPELLALAEEARDRGLAVGVAGPIEDSRVDIPGLSFVDDPGEVKRLSREYFVGACLALQTPPSRCLYVDVDDRAVSAARVAGLSAYRWNSPADLPYVRAALGLT